MALDGLPVAACDRPGQLESGVHDSTDERVERFGRGTGRFEQGASGGAQGDEVVRRHRRAGVVGGALLLREVEWTQPERLGEPPADRARVICLRRYGTPGAVELLRSSRLRERLQR